VVASMLGKAARGHGTQVCIDQWDQPVQRLRIAVAPINQKPGELRGWIHRRIRWGMRRFYTGRQRPGQRPRLSVAGTGQKAMPPKPGSVVAALMVCLAAPAVLRSSTWYSRW